MRRLNRWLGVKWRGAHSRTRLFISFMIICAAFAFIFFWIIPSLSGNAQRDLMISYISTLLTICGLMVSDIVTDTHSSDIIQRSPVSGSDIEYMSTSKFNQICACLDYWKLASERPAVLSSCDIESLQKKLLDNSTIDCSNDVVMVCLDLHESIEIHEIYGMYVAGSPVHIELSEHDYIADIRTNQRQNVAGDTPQTYQQDP